MLQEDVELLRHLVIVLFRAPLAGYKSVKKEIDITGYYHKIFYVLLLTSFNVTIGTVYEVLIF